MNWQVVIPIVLALVSVGLGWSIRAYIELGNDLRELEVHVNRLEKMLRESPLIESKEE